MLAEVKHYTFDEIAKNNGKNGARTWIVIKGVVYDVTDYLDEHPGGGELITEWAGKDATKAFDDFGHSADAKKELKPLKIGQVEKGGELKTSEKSAKVVNSTDKEARRSCCSYITCGLVG